MSTVGTADSAEKLEKYFHLSIMAKLTQILRHADGEQITLCFKAVEPPYNEFKVSCHHGMFTHIIRTLCSSFQPGAVIDLSNFKDQVLRVNFNLHDVSLPDNLDVLRVESNMLRDDDCAGKDISL